jgi:hypothetical protein
LGLGELGDVHVWCCRHFVSLSFIAFKKRK